MKRGKDEEKSMGPMFPRLHVNDTEKGGPRAPPRNKMALYEQLTIPSQRHNSGPMPPNQNNNSNLVPSTSTSQGTGRERNMYFPLHRPSPSYDENQVRRTEAVSLVNQQVQVENKKRPLEEDDFMVPIFHQPGTEMRYGKTQNSTDGNRNTDLRLNHHTVHPTIDKESNQSNMGNLTSKQQTKNQDGRNSKVSDAPTRNSSDLLMREKDDVACVQDTSMQRGHQEKHNMGTLEETDACLLQGNGNSSPAIDSTYRNGGLDQARELPQEETSLKLRLYPLIGSGYIGDNDINSGTHMIEDDQSLDKGSVDGGDDDVSETSMVDSASVLDMTPDDVVEIIGRKHFWKARTAIVNQQRVFAVQVFELHRLIKVQKLIAESPSLLLEGSAFVGKSSLKASAVKKYPPDYTVKVLAHKHVQKDVTKKATDKVEGTAENAVPKAPLLAPSQNVIQPAVNQSPSVNTASSAAGNMDQKMNPWSFHQPGGHQWLVPVMSPSEGLVYKPYPAPGFMGPMCGGCGPVSPTPMVGNLMNPGYRMPSPQYQQGMGMPPGIHFGGQGYFPPYGMPMMSPSVPASTVEQLNQFSGPNPYGQINQPVGASVNLSGQQQNSLNKPSQEDVTDASGARPPKERELQGSTASSPSYRAQRSETAPDYKERGALPLFLEPPSAEILEDALAREKQARVIRVVPHRSTRESAARIFQSIQQERQLYESN